jgi:hypothetical protein
MTHSSLESVASDDPSVERGNRRKTTPCCRTHNATGFAFRPPESRKLVLVMFDTED